MRAFWIGPLAAVVVAAAACSGDGVPAGDAGSAGRASPGAQVAVAATSNVPSTDVSAGEELFGRIGCNGCHTVDGVGGMVGPNLSGVGARPSRDPGRWSTTEAYIRASIEGPEQLVVEGFTPEMPPPDLLGLDQSDIDQLVAYLLTLREES